MPRAGHLALPAARRADWQPSSDRHTLQSLQSSTVNASECEKSSRPCCVTVVPCERKPVYLAHEVLVCREHKRAHVDRAEAEARVPEVLYHGLKLDRFGLISTMHTQIFHRTPPRKSTAEIRIASLENRIATMIAEHSKKEDELIHQADVMKEMYGHLSSEYENLKRDCKSFKRAADAGAMAANAIQRIRETRCQTVVRRKALQLQAESLRQWHAHVANRKCREAALDRSLQQFCRGRAARRSIRMLNCCIVTWINAVKIAVDARSVYEHDLEFKRLREQADAAKMLSEATERRWKMEAKLEAQRAARAETEVQRLRSESEDLAARLQLLSTENHRRESGVKEGMDAEISTNSLAALVACRDQEIEELRNALDTMQTPEGAAPTHGCDGTAVEQQISALPYDALKVDKRISAAEDALASRHRTVVAKLESALEASESKLASYQLKFEVANARQEANQQKLEAEFMAQQQLLETKLALAVETRGTTTQAEMTKNKVIGRPRYRVLKTTIVRAGIEADTAARGRITAGSIIEAHSISVSSQGVTRVEFERGWVSMVAGDGAVLLEALQMTDLQPEPESTAIETVEASKELSAEHENEVTQLAASHGAAMEAAEAAASKKLEEELSALRLALGKEHASALREAELGQAAALREAHMVATEEEVAAACAAASKELSAEHENEVTQLAASHGAAMEAAEAAASK
eukprot:SAG31_NODE_1313_length_8853_cov_60.435458_11_plen_698_part_01